MPVYCKYCHESGHNASSCPKSPSSKRVCFSCFKRGHVRADCPEKHKSAKRHRNGRVVSSASPASDTLLNINTESVDSSASVVSPASTQGPSSALVINTTVSTTTPTTVQVGQEVTPAVDQGKSILNSAGHDTATELDDLSHQSAANDVDMDGTSSESTIDYAPAVTRSPAPSPDITGSAATDPAFPDTVTNKTTATNGPNITGTRLVQTHSGRFSKPPSKWDL